LYSRIVLSAIPLPLDNEQAFDVTREKQFFASLPVYPGVLLIEMKVEGAQPYLARTVDIQRAAERLLRAPEVGSKRLNLREVASRIRYRVAGSKFEQTLALYGQAKEHFPRRYRQLMNLRAPALLKVNLRNAYPRCYVTRRIRADEGFYFGPFFSRRSADSFAEAFLDLFKTRRCQIKIRRDPTFPGCIYSEMKMCLAPCFAGCTVEEYESEIGRVLEALDTGGTAFTERLAQEREAAGETLDFERAAGLHKRLEKAIAALRGLPELARRIDSLDAVILQRASEDKTIIVFPIHSGILGEPIFLRFAELSSQPRPMETILRSQLEAQTPVSSFTNSSQIDPTEHPPESATPTEQTAAQPSDEHRKRYGLRTAPSELSEHLSLVARWFYSNPRQGEIFFRDGDWPYRRILRACSRLLAPPAELGNPAPKMPPSPSSPSSNSQT
jgi:excinuclease ABC subunit C